MNSKDTVAVASRSFSKNDFLIARLQESYSNIHLNNSGQTLQGDDLIKFLKAADKAIIGIEEISNTVLDKLPNLKVISKYGVGLNNLNLNSLKAKGVKLGFTPGVNKQSVAELAFTLALISLKKIHSNHIDILQGQWPQEKGSELYKKNFGLVGFGNIGQKLASLIQPFQCEILFFDKKKYTKNEMSAICKEFHLNPRLVHQVTLSKILNQSDILSIHLPLEDGTLNIIASKQLNQLKKNVCIINTARGGIVNETDLFNFLSHNPNAFAAFDVYEEEPVLSNPLFDIPNFFGTSHRSSLTHEGINAMGMAAIKGLDDNITLK